MNPKTFNTTHPKWIKRPVRISDDFRDTKNILSGLNTVCSSAHCPNLNICFNQGLATFLILGNICTRNCGFCAVRKGNPLDVDASEPSRITDAAIKLKLSHIVITSVTRDDLEDGGSGHFVDCIEKVRKKIQCVTIEVLTPDFKGSKTSMDKIISAHPDVFNHNIETIPRLYPVLRSDANYHRSLDVIKYVSQNACIIVKSGIMLGLGETEEEVLKVLRDLLDSGCSVITIGQYLSPSKKNFPVVEYIPLKRFEYLKRVAYDMGFVCVLSGPFVRSSYKAAEVLKKVKKNGNLKNICISKSNSL
jgi:lipoic acid synthetase